MFATPTRRFTRCARVGSVLRISPSLNRPKIKRPVFRVLIFWVAETMRFELMRVLLPCLVSSEVPSTSSATSPDFYHLHNLTSCTLTGEALRCLFSMGHSATSPYMYFVYFITLPPYHIQSVFSSVPPQRQELCVGGDGGWLAWHQRALRQSL